MKSSKIIQLVPPGLSAWVQYHDSDGRKISMKIHAWALMNDGDTRGLVMTEEGLVFADCLDLYEFSGYSESR